MENAVDNEGININIKCPNLNTITEKKQTSLADKNQILYLMKLKKLT